MRVDHLPHIWCAGCGNGTLTRDVAVAVDELCKDPDERFRLDREKVVIVSGIGCSSRAAGYLDFNSIHTTHGRAIAFATGIKLANPELTVIVITGDGDCSAIGGNHLIHAARRNVDMTVVVYDNNIYGMTGGQYSPTTPRGDRATTAPYGVIDRPFDIAGLAAGAGASLTARGDTYHTRETTDLIKKGIRHKGFSLIDCYSICPTYYGRKNKKGDAVTMLMRQKECGMPAEAYSALPEEEKAGKYVIGTLTHSNYPEFTAEYQKMIDKAMGK
jgi:2-oxoglutarate ferredoxin oxidoreductase subunit beta